MDAGSLTVPNDFGAMGGLPHDLPGRKGQSEGVGEWGMLPPRLERKWKRTVLQHAYIVLRDKAHLSSVGSVQQVDHRSLAFYHGVLMRLPFRGHALRLSNLVGDHQIG